MMRELIDRHKKAQATYESVLGEEGLVRKLRSSSLQPCQKDILEALFEQGGRTFYKDKIPSFNDEAKEKHKPTHYPSLLHESAVFLELSIASMKKFISQTNEQELKEDAQSFYTEIHSIIGLYLHRDVTNPKMSNEIRDIIYDFYDWHIRPTLNVAMEMRFDTKQKTKPQFGKDIKEVREHMNKIFYTLVQTISYHDPYKEIIKHTSNVLEIINTTYLDKEYSRDSLERKLLVNLYAGTYFIKYAAEDHIKNPAAEVKKNVPRHSTRFNSITIKDFTSSQHPT